MRSKCACSHLFNCYSDLQTSTQVSRVQEGEDSLCNQGHSCWVQLSWNIIVLWWVGKHVCSAPIFMDKVTLPTAGNYHASKKQIEFIVFPIQRWPLATFNSPLTPWHKSRPIMHVQPPFHSSVSIKPACLAWEWVQWESGYWQETPWQSEDICGTKRLRRL